MSLPHAPTETDHSYDTNQDGKGDKAFWQGGEGHGDGEGGYDKFGGMTDQDQSLNRDMVKQVSALIVERETAIIKAKQRAEEVTTHPLNTPTRQQSLNTLSQ